MAALRRGDPAPLRQIYVDDYSLVTPPGVIRSKTGQINELASGRLQQKIELLERNVRVYDDADVLVHSVMYLSAIDGLVGQSPSSFAVSLGV